jgi:hypothetical protein
MQTITPKDLPLHQELGEELQALRGLRIALLVNRGNRGDGVIHRGGRELLQRLGLVFEEIYETRAPETLEADVLLVFANGAFCRVTHTMIAVTERLARRVKRVILLPGSFETDVPAVADFARRWDERYTVYCRETVSHAGLLALGVPPERLRLSHDLALAADLSVWAARPQAGRIGIFRRDKEITFERRPRDLERHDASHGPDTEADALLDFVSRYSEIHTDRTHAAITGAMMGRQVWMYCNCYFKNEAIYRHSLSTFPNVHFVGKQPFSFFEFGRALYWKARRHAYKTRAWARGLVGKTAPAR